MHMTVKGCGQALTASISHSEAVTRLSQGLGCFTFNKCLKECLHCNMWTAAKICSLSFSSQPLEGKETSVITLQRKASEIGSP